MGATLYSAALATHLLALKAPCFALCARPSAAYAEASLTGQRQPPLKNMLVKNGWLRLQAPTAAGRCSKCPSRGVALLAVQTRKH